MNPFFDLGLRSTNSFGQMSAPSQMPFYFGPDIPYVSFEDSPTTDNSIHDATTETDPQMQRNSPTDGADRHDLDFDDLEGIAEQSLSLPHAPGNISDTISRLMTR